jgi:hypothetical protein
MRSATAIQGAVIDYAIADQDALAIAGGLITLHMSGHCAGHLAFL